MPPLLSHKGDGCLLPIVSLDLSVYALAAPRSVESGQFAPPGRQTPRLADGGGRRTKAGSLASHELASLDLNASDFLVNDEMVHWPGLKLAYKWKVAPRRPKI